MKQSLYLKQAQKLTMTPQLKQAIKLLELPIIDLDTKIREELENNIMLEKSNIEFEQNDKININKDLEKNQLEWTQTNNKKNNSEENIESTLSSSITLRDHLMWQLEMEKISEKKIFIGKVIIDSLNDDGYLNESFSTIKNILGPETNIQDREIENILEIIQNLDPVGVGARSIIECISLQLDRIDKKTPGIKLAIEINKNYFNLFTQKKISKIKDLLMVSDDDLRQAILLIKSCNPHPGLSVSNQITQYAIPDVFVKRINNNWVVELNNSLVPKIKINNLYAESINSIQEHKALKMQLQEAHWLIKSLNIRNQTLAKVAINIVERQKAFLEKGEEYMNPMIMKQVASDVDVHESTISRIASNKYMHTPRGTYQFKYFFSSNLEGKKGGTSSIAIKAKIKKIINNENPNSPLSDTSISDRLHLNGIKIARRTVAKYREDMKIEPSSKRKATRWQ
ncbi:MAG: RNA polymerase sigma-54 factor [Gammaproteobacteria bacterium TMED78]|nr:MAG: RNA polymerase sigma-54 factor [Gammaproteobacteria bacterium TMED78]|tara:strand:+ start:95020 stop:96381 length:1362 start_codon:yes stop_codon:yes gene_type:complete